MDNALFGTIVIDIRIAILQFSMSGDQQVLRQTSWFGKHLSSSPKEQYVRSHVIAPMVFLLFWSLVFCADRDLWEFLHPDHLL